MVPYLLQLALIGLAWISVHCIGMCGPIVAGVVTAGVEPNDARSSWSEGALRVLAYQGGRAVTYALLGAAAGWLGQTVDGAIRAVGDVAALAVGVALLGVGIWRLAGWQRPQSSNGERPRPGTGGVGATLMRASRTLVRLVPATGRWRIALFGAAMGFLPCMLMFWVLGLAASTGDPLAGGLLLVGLVVLTTPVLLAAGSSPLLASGFLRRHRHRAVGAALTLSGVWLTLIGAASNGWIRHASWEFVALDRVFRLMLW